MSQASVLLSSISSENKLLTAFYYGTFKHRSIDEEGFLFFCVRFFIQKIHSLIMVSYVIDKFISHSIYSIMGNFSASKSRLQNSPPILNLR